eukprot:4786070-Pleurochrysis_carterae.AAC.1
MDTVNSALHDDWLVLRLNGTYQRIHSGYHTASEKSQPKAAPATTGLCSSFESCPVLRVVELV